MLTPTDITCNILSNEENIEHNFDVNYKVIIIGNNSVGKTCINNRIIRNIYDPNYEPTLGFDYSHFFLKANDKIIKLSLWDTCGQEKYRSLISNFYRNSSFVLLVYSIDNRQSFDSLEGWLNDVRTAGNAEIQICLIGNKSDLTDNRQITEEEGKEFARVNDINYFFETSALTGENIKDMFIQIGKILYVSAVEDEKYKDEIKLSKDSIVDTLSAQSKKKKSGGCCSS